MTVARYANATGAVPGRRPRLQEAPLPPDDSEDARLRVPHDAWRYSSPAYREMLDAVHSVARSVNALVAALPKPGESPPVGRIERVSEAERDLFAAWVQYMYTYDSLYAS